ncbi:hypothetical protein AB5J72_34955 [Streptomyces sp. CG1]|uniref:hypothetical protein n=1 Tax=Streptomyces sp. CG1 TaxID=1287523 RepID=UPI0034E2F656
MKIHTGRGTDTATDKHQGRRACVRTNDRDTATLTEANGTRADSCSWTPRDPSDKYC